MNRLLCRQLTYGGCQKNLEIDVVYEVFVLAFVPNLWSSDSFSRVHRASLEWGAVKTVSISRIVRT